MNNKLHSHHTPNGEEKTKQNPKIVLSEETKKELASLGSKEDTFEDIVKRLIKLAKEVNKKVK